MQNLSVLPEYPVASFMRGFLLPFWRGFDRLILNQLLFSEKDSVISTELFSKHACLAWCEGVRLVSILIETLLMIFCFDDYKFDSWSHRKAV